MYSNLDAARALAEDLRASIERASFEFEDRSLHVSMTFGVAQFMQGDDFDGCLLRADGALDKGKEGGRNQVQIASADGFGRP